MLCIECNNKKGILRTKLDMYLCKDCSQLKKFVLISKTNAIKDYLLVEEDLEEIEVYKGRRAYGRGEAEFYLQEKIIELASSKYDTEPNNIDDKIEEIKLEKKNERYEKYRMNKNIRKDRLKKHLEKAGLELRNDSTLCRKYIDNEDNLTIKPIVNRMCQMKYLFEYCNMDECKDEAYEEYSEAKKNGYYLDSSVFDIAEEIALRKYSNGKYPAVFPWLKK